MPPAAAGGSAAGFAGASCNGARANNAMSVTLCMATNLTTRHKPYTDLWVS
jgi:hypothetical protein